MSPPTSPLPPNARVLRLFACLGILLGFLSCGKKAGEIIEVRAPESLGVLDSREAEALRSFGHEFAEDVSARNFARLAETFDYTRLLDRAFDGVRMDARVLGDFREGAIRGMGSAEGGVLRGAVGQNYRFLRVIEADGESQLLFRFINADGKLDYHRFKLAKDSDGKVRLYDFYGFLAGEYASASLRRMAWSVVADMGGIAADGRETTGASSVESLTVLGEQIGGKQFEEALATLRDLPAEVRGQRFLLITEIQLLAALPGRRAEYAQALDRFATDFGEDPASALLLANGASGLGDFAEMRVQVARLATAVGSDAYHDVIMAASYAGEGDYQKALNLAGRAVASEPELREAWLFIVRTGLEAGDFGAVASALVRLKNEFGYGFRRDQFEGIPDYADFVGSSEGKAFLGMLGS